MEHDRWHSVKEMANYLGIKPDTLYKWISRKKIPAHKVGRLWKFRKEEVDKWITVTNTNFFTFILSNKSSFVWSKMLISF